MLNRGNVSVYRAKVVRSIGMYGVFRMVMLVDDDT